MLDGDPEHEELKEAVEKTQTVLFLSLKSHDIEFNQNGTVKFTVQYIASIEAAFQSEKTNILSSPNIQQQISQLEEEKAQLTTQKREEQTRLQELGLEDSDNGTSEEQEISVVDELQSQIELVDEEINTVRAEASRKILSKLHDKKRIKFIDIDATELGVMQESSNALSQDIQGMMSSLIYQTEEGEVNYTSMSAAEAEAGGYTEQLPEWAVGGEQSAAQNDVEAIQQNDEERIQQALSPDTEEVTDEEEGTPNGENNSADELQDTIPEGKHRLYYIYFGDILESVLEILVEEDPNALKGTGIMTGPFTFKDIARDIKAAINIADVPISLNLYRIWFLKNTNFKRSMYLLKYYLSDIVRSLIQPALGKQCWERTSEPRANYNFANLAISADSTGADPLRVYRADNSD